MKRLFLFAGAFAVAACSQAAESPLDSEPSASSTETGALMSIFALGSCTVSEEDIVGTISISIPPSLNGNGIARAKRVTYRAGIPSDPNDPGTQPPWSPNKPDTSDPPFDVFMDNTGSVFGSTGYALVRVAIVGNNGWNFLVDETQNFYGVGSYSDNDAILCGVNPIGGDPVNPGNKAKSVASFYVDLNQLNGLGQDAHFVIGLQAEDTVDSPILIDPKIWNSGAGIPMGPGPDAEGHRPPGQMPPTQNQPNP